MEHIETLVQLPSEEKVPSYETLRNKVDNLLNAMALGPELMNELVKK